jgi:chromate transporter
MHRTLGGITAGTLFILPSLIILIALSWLYLTFGNTPLVAGIFYGIKPAVTAIVLHAAWRIGSRALHGTLPWVVAVAAFVAIFVWSVPFPMIIIAAAVFGWVATRFDDSLFAARGNHGPASSTHHAAVIDDDTALPAHALFKRSRFLTVITAAW